MKLFKELTIALAAVSLFTTSCIKDEEANIEADITEVVFPNPQAVYSVKVGNESVLAFVDSEKMDLKQISLQFKLSEGATIRPASDNTTDFSTPVRFLVTSEDKRWVKNYTITLIDQEIPTRFGFESWRLVEGKRSKYDFPIVELETKGEDGTVLSDTMDIWSCGNELFAIIGKVPQDFPTAKTTHAYSGQYAARLETKLTGQYGMEIAAGNLFIGEFDNDEVDHLKATHYGLPFKKKPLRLQGRYSYKPKTIFEGTEMDQCNIYAVLYKTSDKVKYLDSYTIADLSNPNIIARAQLSYLGETVGNDFHFFDLPFEYSGNEVEQEQLCNGGYNLAVVFSSSKNGGSFVGGVGSCLLVDDVEIITEE